MNDAREREREDEEREKEGEVREFINYTPYARSLQGVKKFLQCLCHVRRTLTIV
jgi:hypothetical protein